MSGLRKSQSLPGLQRTAPFGVMALGTGKLPSNPNGSFHRKSTLSVRLNHGAVDTHKGSPLTAEVKSAAELLRAPGWRQQQNKELNGSRTPTSAMVEDLVHTSMRHPRVVPAWLKHDKQVLRFYGFFQESVIERPDENSRYRHVAFMYYMEDGTMQISETKVENSGIPQGIFLKRHRVPQPGGAGFVGPDDFRCGGTVEIYGRTYQVTGCDRFTRWFYEENGIDVGEDEPLPEDRWQKSYKFNKVAEKGGLPMTAQAMDAKNLTKFVTGQPPVDLKVKQFLDNDRKVLRFKAFWDDTTAYGARTYFVIHYFLADNTMEINEAHSRNSGRDHYPVFAKRAPQYKKNSVNAYPGMLSAKGDLYMPEDLRVGDFITLWGRNIMLYDCDDFTREFYMGYMGIDPAENKLDVSDKAIQHIKLTPPPHNGIGTEEDSLQNCHMLQPKAAKQDLEKLMTLSGESLRFEAKMMNNEPEDECRRFVIAFFPDTDTMGVYELHNRNSGHMAGKFRERSKMKNQATGRYFESTDLYVGAIVTVCAQPFKIIKADEHCLQFMEARPEQFTVADPAACVRRILFPLADHPQCQGEVEPEVLKDLAAEAGVPVVDHEVVTLLRRFGKESSDNGVVISVPDALGAV